MKKLFTANQEVAHDFIRFLQYIGLRKKPIYIQLDNYRAWKSIYAPVMALSHYHTLREFLRKHKPYTVTDIQLEHISTFINQQNSVYYRQYTHRTFRQFFRYCHAMGYADLQLGPLTTMGTVNTLNKVSSLLHVNQVKRVKYLKDEKVLTFREVQARMEKEDKRKYDLKTLHRWYHYKLPEGV